jgi:hypothetical protein
MCASLSQKQVPGCFFVNIVGTAQKNGMARSQCSVRSWVAEDAQHLITRFASCLLIYPAARGQTTAWGQLIYLALTTQQAHRRELLATLFWPDDPETVAQRNLRQSLYRLRLLLGME